MFNRVIMGYYYKHIRLNRSRKWNKRLKTVKNQENMIEIFKLIQSYGDQVLPWM